MNEIFQIVYEFLKWISKITGMTYHEVNIIVYFIIIPGIFIYLLGRFLKRKSLILVFGVLVLFTIIIVPDFKIFSTKLFDLSVDFLNWFDQVGLNYIQASVVICVIVPIIIIFILFYMNKRKHLNKNVS